MSRRCILLLDTQLLIKATNTPMFSVASLWELVMKQALNRPGFNVQTVLLRRALLECGWEELTITANHVLAVADLPPLHRAPFDRLLLAQAKADGLLLITSDEQLARYPGPIRWMAHCVPLRNHDPASRHGTGSIKAAEPECMTNPRLAVIRSLAQMAMAGGAFADLAAGRPW